MQAQAYLGLDVHRKTTTAALVWRGEEGELVEKFLGEVATDAAKLGEAASQWQEKYAGLWPPVVVVEAGGLATVAQDALVEWVDEIWQVDPSKVALLREGAKTDRRDAVLLAELAAKGLIRGLWMPPRELVAKRAVLRTRRFLTKVRTAAANRIGWYAKQAGVELGPGHVWSRRNLAALKTASWANNYFRLALEPLVRQVEVLTCELGWLEEELEALYAESEDAQLLATLPRCGKLLGLTLAFEIGDPRRFRSAAALRSYAALAPRVHESGGKRRGQGLVHQGNRHLKWALGQLANQLCFLPKGQDPLGDEYHRWRRRLEHHPYPNLRVRMVLASRLCDVVHALLRDRRAYDPRWPQGGACAAA
jgi:transposase